MIDIVEGYELLWLECKRARWRQRDQVEEVVRRIQAEMVTWTRMTTLWDGFGIHSEDKTNWLTWYIGEGVWKDVSFTEMNTLEEKLGLIWGEGGKGPEVFKRKCKIQSNILMGKLRGNMGLIGSLTRAINVGIISVFKTIEKNEITQDMSSGEGGWTWGLCSNMNGWIYCGLFKSLIVKTDSCSWRGNEK